MKRCLNDAGNSYVLVETAKGVPTFRHVATGENLHGQVGPWEEAIALYIEPSGLLSHSGSVVVYDVGMGCAAQVLATLWAWRENSKIDRCEVVSFDLEKQGLESLLSHAEKFLFAQRERVILERMVLNDSVSIFSDDGREFVWRFLGGDYRETVVAPAMKTIPKADKVFYDFFSPASHPELWTCEMFSNLWPYVSQTGTLFTYSCATRVRAALLAAGFCVGLGVPSGKKAKTTVAAVRFSDLREPLPAAWLETFRRSDAGYFDCEKPVFIEKIRENIFSHRQFAVNLR